MKRRSHDVLKVPLSTLIDVVFLLIIFFILTAKFQDETLDDKVNLAESFYVEPVALDMKLTVNIRRDAKTGTILVMSGGIPLDWDKLSSQAYRYRKLYKKQIPVVIRADRDMQYGEVDKVCQRLAALGFYKVRHSTNSSFRQYGTTMQ